MIRMEEDEIKLLADEMEDKLTKGFEKLLKNMGAKIITVCRVSKDGKCEEDLKGYCYHCGRNMLEDKE